MFYLNYYTNRFSYIRNTYFGKFLSGGALLLMLSYVFLQVGDRRVGLLLVVYKTTLLTVEVIPIILCRQGFPPCMNRTWECRCLSKCARYAFISSSDSPLSPPLKVATLASADSYPFKRLRFPPQHKRERMVSNHNQQFWRLSCYQLHHVHATGTCKVLCSRLAYSHSDSNRNSFKNGGLNTTRLPITPWEHLLSNILPIISFITFSFAT